jgi:leucyl/phenylalanyl-tRNA--protein transferase
VPIYQLGEAAVFPPADRAHPSGLLAVGGDLRPERLLAAYAAGIFPWFGEGDPILWHSPPARMVLELDALHVGRTLRRALRRRRYQVRLDGAFEAVVRACAGAPRPGQDGTWITADMRAAYVALHGLGFAHSVEAWDGAELVGGLYGVALGRAFFGESMFAVAADASKVALATLVAELRLRGYHLIDCQVYTPLFASLGAREIPRADFLARLGRALLFPTDQGRWRFSTATGEAPLPQEASDH